MAERSEANEEHLNQFIVEAYEQIDFSLSMLANRLKVVEHAGPMPPAVEKTKGTKLAPSTLRSLCSYWRLFERSCLEYRLVRDAVRADGALG